MAASSKGKKETEMVTIDDSSKPLQAPEEPA